MNVNQMLDMMITHKKMIAIVGGFLLLSVVMIGFGIIFKKADPLKPKGRLLMLGEMVMDYFSNFTRDVVGDKNYRGLTPLAICIFTSIFLTNIAGLFLLEEGAFANPLYPFTWSILMFLAWNAYAIWKLGIGKFLKNIVTPVLLTPLNIIGMVTKPLSMGLRLLGNISAGSMIMMLFWFVPAMAGEALASLPTLGGFFGTALGAIVGIIITILGAAMSGYFSLFGPFIQATVFTTLTLASFEETISEKEEMLEGE